MKIFYIQYESIPTSESNDYKGTGGAFINCWIKATSIEAAKNMAENSINENNWKILSLEESFLVNEEHYKENDESREFYQQAVIDGEVYVYHSWTNEAQEEQVH